MDNANNGDSKMNIDAEPSWFEKMLILLAWLLGIILIYWLILKLTNHSPTLEQVAIVVGGVISTLVMRHHYKLGQLDEFRKMTMKEFSRIHVKLEKIDDLATEIALLRADVATIKSTLNR